MRDDYTKEWSPGSFNTIFLNIAQHASAYHRFPTVKRFKYDTTKLTNYDPGIYNLTITKKVERQKLWDLLKELMPLHDGMDTAYDIEYVFNIEYMQSSSYN